MSSHEKLVARGWIGMNKRELKQRRRQLEQLASRMRDDRNAAFELVRSASGGQGSGELSNAPLHLGDNGTEEYLYDMNATLLENEDYLLNEVNAALHRIDKGTYGDCEHCGQVIRTERLDAIPYVRYCVKCAETVDIRPRVNLNSGRPLDPQDTLAPEGEMGEDRRRSKRTRLENAKATPNHPTKSPDKHAAGTVGGGTAIGGIAGTNIGHGDPELGEIQNWTATGQADAIEARGKKRGRPRAKRQLPRRPR